MLTKRTEKKLDWNSTRMLQAISKPILEATPRKQQLHGHLAPITKIIQLRQTKHVGHWWRSKIELISDVLLRLAWPLTAHLTNHPSKTNKT